MVYRRITPAAVKTKTRSRPHSAWRANPWGLARLLITCATVGLLTLGTSFWWWLGFFLLSLIVLTLARPRETWAGVGAVLAALLDMALWHLHVIPLWIFALFLLLSAGEWLLSRLSS
ncbi:MAG: hypothetical protein OWU84_03860 [Firmicutes bacterium]|nr:hypothetical protein [Bacillota bacterium]